MVFGNKKAVFGNRKGFASLRRASPQGPQLRIGTLPKFLLEQQEDKKPLRVALVVAVLAHGALLAVNLPKTDWSTREIARERQVYVVQPLRFKPPPPKQQNELPRPKHKKRMVPVPDPTPDQPEPMLEEIELEIELPDIDTLFDIPAGPPGASGDGIANLPTNPPGPLHLGGDMEPPEKLFAPPPAYTNTARMARIEGSVVLQTVIDASGNVAQAKVLKGLPLGLNEITVEAVKRWKFKPATSQGKPVSVYFILTVDFSLLG